MELGLRYVEGALSGYGSQHSNSRPDPAWGTAWRGSHLHEAPGLRLLLELPVGRWVHTPSEWRKPDPFQLLTTLALSLSDRPLPAPP